MSGANDHSSANSDKQRVDESQMRIGWRMVGLAWLMSSEVAAGALIGWGWDEWQGTDRTGLMIGASIGIAVGLFSLIRGAYKAVNEMDRIERRVKEHLGSGSHRIDRERGTGPGAGGDGR